jgi:RimJ/RimL family protein N-acetyltransferase
MSDSAAQICDGRGCDRLGLALTQPVLAKDGRRLSLRLAAAADESILLEWQSHPTTRRFARNSAVPSPSEHHDWFTARRADPDCLLTLITLDDAPAGMLRLDPVAKAASAAAPAYEISILVAPDERGNGAALEALRFLRRWQGKALLIATVLPGNDASAALFEAAGYRPGADGLLYNPPPAAGTRTPALCVDAQRL